ncbi:LapA family protein [Endozoicomonadaceae bacterium StTr2]
MDKVFRAATWLLYIVITAVLLLLLVNFVEDNSQPVALIILGGKIPSLQISTLVIGSFIIGACAGLISAATLLVRHRLERASLKRKLKRRDAEIRRLRQQSLKGLS